MYIRNLSLQYFRNYESLNISFNPKLNILCGDNAQGKTNILEAIYICSVGRSQRTQFDRDIINLNKTESHIQLNVVEQNSENRIDVHLKRNSKKGIAVDGIPLKKLNQLFGTLYTVIFSPEDLQLIKSGPSERRKFMDMELCQLSSVYYYDLQQYYKILKHRNNLLKNIDKPKLKDTLSIWDSQLVLYGKKIIDARTKFIDRVNLISSNIHSSIVGNRENMTLKYTPDISKDEFETKLNRHVQRDIFQGNTSVGPHRDDIQFFIDNKNVRIYGSQGQQRTAALSVKLAEIKLIKEETMCEPVLLLDDVLSELDEKRQEYLLSTIENIQTVITCTGIEDCIKKYVDKSKIYFISNATAQLFSNSLFKS